MSGHTPGPWTTKRAFVMTDGCYDHAIIADGQVVAEAFGRSDTSVYHDSEANARLIAAAPDLMSALKALLEACVLADSIEELPSDVDGTLLDAARLAIAKAEGHDAR